MGEWGRDALQCVHETSEKLLLMQESRHPVRHSISMFLFSSHSKNLATFPSPLQRVV